MTIIIIIIIIIKKLMWRKSSRNKLLYMKHVFANGVCTDCAAYSIHFVNIISIQMESQGLIYTKETDQGTTSYAILSTNTTSY